MTAQARRSLVEVLVGRGISVRRACVLLSVARSGVGYESRLVAKDKPLERLLRRFVKRYPRRGYRQAWRWLRRKGHKVNRKRVYRLWCRAGLTLPRRKSYRRSRSGKRIDPVAGAPNEVWASDIIQTYCANGQKVRCLTVLDECTRECLALEGASSMRAECVVRTLASLVDQYGAPKYLRTDNGSEFISRRTQQWLRDQSVQSALIDPGAPWQNGFVESFHSRFRDECLDREWFNSVTEARVIIEEYRRSYNTDRPHSSLGFLTPAEMRADYDTKVDTENSQMESQHPETVPN
jgi:putative transposase